MKYLRMTMWIGRTANPMTTIIAETDLTVSIYTAANDQRFVNTQTMGPAIEVEVHVLPDALSTQDAVLQIIKSRPEPLTEEEHAKHTLFDWAMATLETINPGGTAQTTKPGPLNEDTVTAILRRVATEPTYKDQTFNIMTPDRTEVSLVGGQVVTSKPH